MRAVIRSWSRHRLVSLATLCWLLTCGTGSRAAAAEPVDPHWSALHQLSRQAVAGLVGAHDPAVGSEAAPVAGPRMVVVGFTGGLEGRDSRVSGVVQLQRKLAEHVGHRPDIVTQVYSNFAWRQAADDVLSLGGTAGAKTPPLIVVYGHSWGGGAITKFARALAREGRDVGLGIYIDAFTFRNPRVPPNVRYAVNVYQRTGLLRGFPLRGRGKLIAESPDDTVILGNLRVTPETRRFGWNWNLVQPLLYRQHHRIGHDERIQRFLIDLVSVVPVPSAVELPAGTNPQP